MNAIRYHRYGGPENLVLEDVPVPEVLDSGVLVRVHATSVNAYDWHMLRGKPYIARLGEGFRRPRTPLMGLDVAGVVEAVGKDVADLRVGDRVFGSRHGAFAELVSGRLFAPMPAGLSFEEAAAVPVAGSTALQAIGDRANVRPGQEVLVVGAGGGVGTFAVQIAKAFGGRVTAVTGPGKVEMVRSIGADEVIDYSREDITQTGRRFDAVIDVAGARPLRQLTRCIAMGGTMVLVGPGKGDLAGPVLHIASAIGISRLRGRRIQPFLSKPSRADLFALRDLVEAGKVRPVVDRVYPFAEIAEAIRYVETNQAAGKVIVTMPLDGRPTSNL
jgi:NADPH:quinone reductase-like Zn-dependent oxidoreductase